MADHNHDDIPPDFFGEGVDTEVLTNVGGPRDGATMVIPAGEWPDGETKIVPCAGTSCPCCGFPGIEAYRREGDKCVYVETVPHLIARGGPLDGAINVKPDMAIDGALTFCVIARQTAVAVYRIEGDEMTFQEAIAPKDMPPDMFAQYSEVRGYVEEHEDHHGEPTEDE